MTYNMAWFSKQNLNLVTCNFVVHSSCHHLCKHLVQAVGILDLTFWQAVVRRRTVPLYRHPLLVPKSSDGLPSYVQKYDNPDDGSITDGDDHKWIGNADVLKGGGGWRDFDLESNLGKRSRSHEGPATRSSSPIIEDESQRQAIRYGDNNDELDEEVSTKSLTFC